MQFRGNHYFLSNMCPCPNGVGVMIDDKIYKFSCVESAFQAHKDPSRADEFEKLDGYAAKKLGRRVTLRSDWENIKDDLMLSLVTAKFLQNYDMYCRLLKISDEIVEENTWNDTYWGVCNGRGLNKLGKILMQVRDTLPQHIKETHSDDEVAQS